MPDSADPRLPAHVEINGLIRRVQAEGGFATVLHKGERDAGTLLIILVERDELPRAYERMPQPDGTRAWHCSARQTNENTEDFDKFIARRIEQDPDLWVIELDIADGERFVVA